MFFSALEFPTGADVQSGDKISGGDRGSTLTQQIHCGLSPQPELSFAQLLSPIEPVGKYTHTLRGVETPHILVAT